MAFDAQYVGSGQGHNLGVHGYRPGEDVWPGGDDVLEGFELFFGVVFTVEIVIKLIGLRLEFLKVAWNYFDVFVVFCWFTQYWASLPINPLIIRLLRLLRLVRLVRLVKHFEIFDSLRVLFGAILACVPVFCWSILVLLMFQVVTGLILNSFLLTFISNSNNSLEARREVFRYFGSFSLTFLTMWELTLGNYAKVSAVLTNNVAEGYGYVITIYKVCVGFAVIRVITGVFLHETFKTAASDDELMIMQKKRTKEKHARKMQMFLKVADETNDGFLQRGELQKILTIEDVRVWLSAQDLDVGDVDLLFDLLDGGSGKISAEELISGVARLKGAARSLDLISLLHMTSELNTQMKDVCFKLDGLRDSLANPVSKAFRPGLLHQVCHVSV